MLLTKVFMLEKPPQNVKNTTISHNADKSYKSLKIYINCLILKHKYAPTPNTHYFVKRNKKEYKVI